MGIIQDFGAALKEFRQVEFQNLVLVGGREVGPRLFGENIEGNFIAEET